MPNIDFGGANQLALAQYFIERYNLVGRDAEYTKNRPTLAMIPRDTEKLKMGNFFDETLRIANGFSGSPGWQVGNQYYTPSNLVKWRVGDPYAQYARLSFDTLALRRNDLGTLIDIKGTEADGVRDEMLNTLEFEIWNDGTGSRSQVTAISGTGPWVYTLLQVSDVYNFPIGAQITGNTLENGTGTNHTNVYQVTDLDPVNGTITVTLTVNNASAVVANDFLFVVGSQGAYMPGISTFIPTATPNGSTVVFGVTQTPNPATSGWRFPFKASISESIQRAFATMGRYVNRAAGRFVVCLSMNDWLYLSLEREGRVFEDPNALQKWGLDGLQVRTPFGPITCIAIPQMADGRGYILDWSSWRLYTLGNLPHIIDEDGLTFLRGGIGAPDGYSQGDLIALQFRIWKVLLCLQPMSNATFATK